MAFIRRTHHIMMVLDHFSILKRLMHTYTEHYQHRSEVILGLTYVTSKKSTLWRIVINITIEFQKIVQFHRKYHRYKAER